jgi:hypothetical protein
MNEIEEIILPLNSPLRFKLKLSFQRESKESSYQSSLQNSQDPYKYYNFKSNILSEGVHCGMFTYVMNRLESEDELEDESLPSRISC